MSPKTCYLPVCLQVLVLWFTGCAPSSSPSMPKSITLDLGNKVTMKLVLIPAGKFMMGSSKEEKEYSKDRERETDQHEVTISKPFYMGIYPVTQEQYKAVMGENPSWFKGDNLPVEQVGLDWDAVIAFCKKASALTGKTVQLPTEAQWEYACRAGTNTRFNTGATIRTDQANYNGEFLDGPGWSENKKWVHRDQTTPVGSFKPNAWGLYDMHGNVWQLCSDWQGPISPGPATDPTGPATNPRGSESCDCDTHVFRGGCWLAFAWTCRSAYREGIPSGGRYTGGGGYFGFRVIVVDPSSQSHGTIRLGAVNNAR